MSGGQLDLWVLFDNSHLILKSYRTIAFDRKLL